MKSACLIVLLVALLAPLAPAQDQPFTAEGVFSRLVIVLGELNGQIKDPESGAQALHRGFDLKIVQGRVTQSLANANKLATTRIDYSKPFLQSTDLDREVFEKYLQTIKRKIFVTLLQYNQVQDASTDLGFKASFVQKTGRSAVETTVNTLDDQGQDVANCEVFYTPFLKDDPQHREKFDKRSTPTTDLIPPGKWNIWSEKQGKAGTRTPYMCGSDGRDKRFIDIAAPQ